MENTSLIGKEDIEEKKDILYFIELLLYLIGGILIGIKDINIVIYIAFLFSTVSNIIKYVKTKKIYYIYKILIYSIIIPNNYIIILILFLFSLFLFIKNRKISFNNEKIFVIALIIINIIAHEFRPINLLFTLIYSLSIFLVIYITKNTQKDLTKEFVSFVKFDKQLIIIQLITIILSFVFHLSEVKNSIANDWVVGTFGYHQGNIFLFFMIFSLLILKMDYKKTKNKFDIIYISLVILLAVLTNSIALIIMFIVSYFITSFFNEKLKNKLINLMVLMVGIVVFIIVTPQWIRVYLINLTDFNYLKNNIIKIQTYEDTFLNIPEKDAKFFFLGNGIGQYSSRAAMTCTGKYIDSYEKFFKPSISDYTEKYILKKYIRYNLKEGQGTMYSPFSSIITIQGEYGIFGTIMLLYFIFKLLKNSNNEAKAFIIFFFLSCFIENYLEFAKVTILVFMLFNMKEEGVKEDNVKK